VFYVASEI